MACRNIGHLCDKLIISQNINFANGTLAIILPDDVDIVDKNKYCIVLAQALPADTTINADVIVRIAGSPKPYPLVNKDFTPVSVRQIFEKTRYSTRFLNNIQDGVFRLMSDTKCGCCPCCAAEP